MAGAQDQHHHYHQHVPSLTFRRTVEPWRCPLCQRDCRPKKDRVHEPCMHFIVVTDTMDSVRTLADAASREHETYALTYHRGVAVTWFVFEVPDRSSKRAPAWSATHDTPTHTLMDTPIHVDMDMDMQAHAGVTQERALHHGH